MSEYNYFVDLSGSGSVRTFLSENLNRSRIALLAIERISMRFFVCLLVGFFSPFLLSVVVLIVFFCVLLFLLL